MTNAEFFAAVQHMNAAQVWAAWKQNRLQVGHVLAWQDRTGLYFNPDGSTFRPGQEVSA